MILSRRPKLLTDLRRLIHTTPVVSVKLPHVWVNIDSHEFHKIIKYVRPDKLAPWDPRRTLDLRPQEQVDPNWLRLEYRPFADIIDKLPDDHRRIFTVGFSKRQDGTKLLLEDSLAKTRRHKYDNTSLDFKITWSTWKIRNMQDLFKTKPRALRNPNLRANTKELIDKRRKWLLNMRHQDYKRFEWIIEVLGIIYKIDPPSTRIERKTSINVLVNMFCNEIRDKKMSEYKAQLEEEKVPFLKMKLETLQAVRADEHSVGDESSVDEDIIATRKLLQQLDKANLTIHPHEINNPNRELSGKNATPKLNSGS